MITIANDVDRKLDANSTSLVPILFVPELFLVLADFSVKFTSLEVTCVAEAKYF